MNLLLLEPSKVDHCGVAAVDGVRARHPRAVLRAMPGRSVRVGLIDGPMGTATVIGIDDERARLACTFEAAPPPVPPVDLLLALPRPKVLQRLWAQLAALGVGRILLTNAERVERNYFDTHVLRPAVYRPLLLEGLQQARDTRVPIVTEHRQFRALVEDHLDHLCPQQTRLLADPGEEPMPGVRADAGQGGHQARPRDILATDRHAGGADAPNAGSRLVPALAPDRILLAIGPEGGWNDFERRLLEARGFERISLGPRTLRTDTACIALHALVTTTAAVASRRTGGIDGPPADSR